MFGKSTMSWTRSALPLALIELSGRITRPVAYLKEAFGAYYT